MVDIQGIREKIEKADKNLIEFVSKLEKEWFKASDDKKNIEAVNFLIRDCESSVSEIFNRNRKEDTICRFKIEQKENRLANVFQYLSNKSFAECKVTAHLLVSKAHLKAHLESVLEDWTSLAIGKLELGSDGRLDISSADSKSFKLFIESVQLGEDLDKSLLVEVSDALISTVLNQVDYISKAVSKPVGRPKINDVLKLKKWAYSEVYNCKKAAEKFHTSESSIKKIRKEINDEEKKFRGNRSEQEHKKLLKKRANEWVAVHEDQERLEKFLAFKKEIQAKKIEAIQAGGEAEDISTKLQELEKELFKAHEQVLNESGYFNR